MATVWSESVTRNANTRFFPVYVKHRQSTQDVLTIPAMTWSVISFLEGIPVEKDVTCETQNLVMQIKLITFSVISRTSEEGPSSSFPARLLQFSLRLSLFYFIYFYYFILFFNFTILYWFCHISTWTRHRYTRVPHPEPSSLLPPRTIPLGRPSAPAPSIQYCASNLDWRLVSYMIL